MPLNPSDWAFEIIVVGDVTFVVFATAAPPFRFPRSIENQQLREFLGGAPETMEFVFEVRNVTINVELTRLGFVHGSKKAKDLLKYLEFCGYLIPPSDTDD